MSNSVLLLNLYKDILIFYTISYSPRSQIRFLAAIHASIRERRRYKNKQKNDLSCILCNTILQELPCLLECFSPTWCVTFQSFYPTSSWGRFIQRKELNVAAAAQHTTQNTSLYQSLDHHHR